MSLIELFARIFGGHPRAPRVGTTGTGAVLCAAPAVGEPAEAEPLDLPAELPWWIPSEPAVLAPPPRAYLADPSDPLGQTLELVLDDPNMDLPLLPMVAQRALVLLHDEEVDYHALAELVGQDQAIAAEVLRVVNTAAYARLFKINQLETAFARLGCGALRSILVAMAVKGMAIHIGGPVRTLAEEIWQRSIVSGVLLNHVSPRRGLPEGEAFLVGLLHDIGNLALLRVLHDYLKVNGGSVSRASFDGLSADWHERLGARIAEAWRLPQPLPAIISAHHAPPASDDPLADYRCLVQFADVVCSLLGYATYVPYDFFALPCVQRLGFRDNESSRSWLSSLPALIAERAGVF